MPDDGTDTVPSSGCFIAIVGPSGVGKDTLIDAARCHFAGNPKILFPRRYITRPDDAGGEDHIAVSDAKFEDMVNTEAFALYWHAHGLRYGIPSDADQVVSKGGAIVCNLSRAVLSQVRSRYSNRLIISVQADHKVLANRLAGRGRETEAEITHRLQRASLGTPDGPDVLQLDNSGPPDVAASILISEVESRLTP